MKGNTFKPFLDISKQIGLECVFGPVHQNFDRKNKFKVKKNEIKLYGCMPLFKTAITVLGFIKIDKKVRNSAITKEIVLDDNECIIDDDDDSWDTDDESESPVIQPTESSVEYKIEVCQDKFTQTYKKHFCKSSSKATDVNRSVIKTEELYSLVDHLCKLVDVLSQFKKLMSSKKHGCHCH